MRKNVIGCLVIAVAAALLPRTVSAASAFKTMSALGSGSVVVGFTGCADITCAGSCFCAEGTIPFKGTGIGSGMAHIEMLMDNNTQTENVAGVCENAGGLMFFTVNKSSNALTFGLSGRFCKTNPSNFAPAMDTGGFNILSGEGNLTNAGGSGSFSFGGPTLSETGTGTMQLQLLGSFNKTANTAAIAASATSTAEHDPTSSH